MARTEKDKYAVFGNQPSMTPDEIVSTMRERTGFSLEQGREKATILRISFDSEIPQTAANVSFPLKIATQTVQCQRLQTASTRGSRNQRAGKR